MADNLEGPLTAHERTHLTGEVVRRGRENGTLASMAGIFLVGLAAGLGYIAFAAEAYVATAVAGLVGLGAVYFFFLSGGGKPPEDLGWRVSIIEGTHSWKLSSMGKIQQRKELIGDQYVEVPPHWVPTLSKMGHRRVRVALQDHLKAPNEFVGYSVLAVEGGPSAEFEHSRGFGACPQVSGASLGIGILCGVVAAAFLYATFQTSADPLRDVRALGDYFAKERVYVNAEALVAERSHARGPLRLEAAWIAPTRWIDGAQDGEAVLLTAGARDRILKERQEIAAEYEAAYAEYETALAAWRKKHDALPFDPKDGLFGRARKAGPRPQPPTAPAAAVASEEILAVLEEAPRPRVSSSPGVDPLTAWLREPTPVQAVWGGGQPPRLLPVRALEAAVEAGAAFLAGLAALVVFLVLAWRSWSQWTAYKAFRAKVAKAYAEEGRFFA